MSNKKKILIVQKIHSAGIQLLKNNLNYEYEVIDVEEMVDKIDSELFKKKIIDCDALSIRTEKLPGNIIEYAKNLKIISRHGVGYDNIDLISAKKNNITIAITATANAVAVSEHVLFMILNIAKGKSMYDKSVKSGNFGNRNKLPKTKEIWKKNMLIVGFGRIGQNLIKRCKGFDMKVKVYDPYVKKAREDGYVSRAAYKLLELDKKDRILRPGMVVVDLGAAPGGWSQVALKMVKSSGRVVAVDLLPLDGIGGVEFIQGDFTEQQCFEDLITLLDGPADLVMSDMAPNMSGNKSIDQPKSVYLVELALDFACKSLKPGGTFIAKIFQGAGIESVVKLMKQYFRVVKHRKPPSSRSRSAEIYLVGLEFRRHKP